MADYFSKNADETTCRQFVELMTDYLEGALSTRTPPGPRETTSANGRLEHTVMVLAPRRSRCPAPG